MKNAQNQQELTSLQINDFTMLTYIVSREEFQCANFSGPTLNVKSDTLEEKIDKYSEKYRDTWRELASK